MILHIDMDAFYASVERADNPELTGKCVIIGGSSNRSVVAAASYEARKYGVRSAMPMFMARQKCPEGIVLPVRMNRYREISSLIMNILRRYSPLVEQVSIDEAFMDVTGCERLHGKPEEIARKIKKSVSKTHGLTCSVGVAPTKFLAKIASDMDKPDGLTVIHPDDVDEFIARLPIEKVPGVGARAHEKLAGIGIRNLGEVKLLPPQTIKSLLGKYGSRLSDLACGIDPSPVTPDGAAKSVGSEETLSADTDDKRFLKTFLLKHSEDVGRNLRKKHIKAKTITLKIKHYDFTQITRSLTLEIPTQSSEAIYTAAGKLLDDYPLNKKVRLIGVSLSGLFPEISPVQMSLFKETKNHNENWEKIDKVVDHIAQKYGRPMVRKANLETGKPSSPIRQPKKHKKLRSQTGPQD